MNAATGDKLDLLCGLKAIALFMGITPRQAQYWAKTTDMPSFDIAGKVCSRKSDLREWLDARIKG